MTNADVEVDLAETNYTEQNGNIRFSRRENEHTGRSGLNVAAKQE